MLFCCSFCCTYALLVTWVLFDHEVCSLQVPFFFTTVVFIGGVLFALQQLSGINSVFYFSSTVFRGVGVPANLANICMGISNLSGEHPSNSYTVLLCYFIWHFLCYLPGSIIAMVLMDKLGRKMLLSGSFLGMVSNQCKQNFFFDSVNRTFKSCWIETS